MDVPKAQRQTKIAGLKEAGSGRGQPKKDIFQVVRVYILTFFTIRGCVDDTFKCCVKQILMLQLNVGQ